MTSELSQRLRAARTAADLRQQDIADACALAGHKVSRSAVAQWEYDDHRRTTPSIEQVKVVAKRTGVPLEWLLNNNSDPAEVWHYTKLAAPMPLVPPEPSADRYTDAYAKAIEFAVIQRRPDLAASFGQAMGQTQPDFAHGKVIALFKTRPVAADTVAQMAAFDSSLTKVVILLDPSAKNDYEVFGIRVCPVSSPDQAAEKLISLCA